MKNSANTLAKAFAVAAFFLVSVSNASAQSTIMTNQQSDDQAAMYPIWTLKRGNNQPGGSSSTWKVDDTSSKAMTWSEHLKKRLNRPSGANSSWKAEEIIL